DEEYTATAYADVGYNGETLNSDTASHIVKVNPEPEWPQLTLTKELTAVNGVAPGQVVAPGSRVTYTITLSAAAGGLDAEGVQMADSMPEGMTVDQTNLPEGAQVSESGAVTWTANVAAGGSTTWQISATLSAEAYAQSVTNTLLATFHGRTVSAQATFSTVETDGFWAIYDEANGYLTYLAWDGSGPQVGSTYEVTVGDATQTLTVSAGNFWTNFMGSQGGAPWLGKAAGIKTVIFKDEITPKNTSGWYEGCTNLATLVNTGNFHTTDDIDMSRMFYGCTSLKSYHIVNATDATSMREMFAGCTALEEIQFPSLSAHDLADMSSMFEGCTSLKNVRFRTGSAWQFGKNVWEKNKSAEGTAGEVSAGVQVNRMFAGCTSLVQLDLRNLYGRYITNYKDMLDGCTNLYVLKIKYRFNERPTATEDNRATFPTSYWYRYKESDNTLIMASRQESGAAVPYKADDPYACTAPTTATSGDGEGDDPEEDGSTAIWVRSDALAPSARGGFAVYSQTDQSLTFMSVQSFLEDKFQDAYPLREMTELYTGWDGASPLLYTATNGGSCYAGTNPPPWYNRVKDVLLTTEVLPNDSVSVTYTSSWFRECSKLREVRNFLAIDVSGCVATNSMFYGCSALQWLNLDGWDTAKVTNMGSMFLSCSALRIRRLSPNWGSGISDEWVTAGMAPSFPGRYWYELSNSNGRIRSENADSPATKVYAAGPGNVANDTKAAWESRHEEGYRGVRWIPCGSKAQEYVRTYVRSSADGTNDDPHSDYCGCAIWSAYDRSLTFLTPDSFITGKFQETYPLRTITEMYFDWDVETYSAVSEVPWAGILDDLRLVEVMADKGTREFVHENERIIPDARGCQRVYVTGNVDMYAAYTQDDQRLTILREMDGFAEGNPVRTTGLPATKVWAFDPSGPIAANTDQVWSEVRSRVVGVTIADEIAPTSMAFWFTGFVNLLDVQGLENVNGFQLQSVRDMFLGCKSLKEIDLSPIDFRHVLETDDF
ncbi:MAG: BspA family leucine-rich repeat surface protein, partial [Eggerthellaceae bacterium]|nr:BspA family leucine-rich repeat surface protein [Eggerthellaceae bacterium]